MFDSSAILNAQRRSRVSTMWSASGSRFCRSAAVIRARPPECLRYEGFGRIRLAVIRLPQITYIAGPADAVLDVELTAELGCGLLHTHTIPLRTDFDIHTMVSDKS
jgi:hypothetical protein